MKKDGNKPYIGNLSSDLGIILSVMTRDEVSRWRTLEGWSGREYLLQLRQAGFGTTDLFATNLIHKDTEDIQPKEDIPPAAERLAEFLHDECPNVRILFVCGQYACQALTGKTPMGKWRGSVIPCILPGLEHIKCVISYDHVDIRTIYRNRYILQVDLDRLKKERERQGIYPPLYNIYTPIHAKEVCAWMDEYQGRVCAVDTETYQPLRISCLSIAPSPTEAISIPLEPPGGTSHWPIGEEIDILLRLDRFLRSTPTYMQNGLYDLFVFHWLGIGANPALLQLDTMLAHHALWPELPHGLDFLCSVYTDQPYYKDEGKVTHATWDWKQHLEYNAKDSCTTYLIAKELEEELMERDLMQFYHQHYTRHIPILLQASLRGIALSRIEQKKIRMAYEGTLRILQEQVNEKIGEKINVYSSPQMLKLAKKLHLKPPINRKTHRPTMNEESLRKLAHRSGNQVLRTIVDIRKIRKVVSNYIDMPTDREDEHLRCQFNLMGTKTGRLSEGPAPTGSGTTMHNIPRAGFSVQVREGIRKLPAVKNMLVAGEGYVFIIPDYKQAETWVVAAMAREKRLMDLLQSGVDIHRWVAANIVYGIPAEEVNTEQRYLTKRTGHAANYGMRENRFADLLVKEDIYISTQEAASLLDKYHQGFPNIQGVYHEYVEKRLEGRRLLRTPLGRERHFLGRLDSETFRDAYSFIPQSTVSDLLHTAAADMSERYSDLQLVGTHHDSVWMRTPAENIEEKILAMWKCMDIEVDVFGWKFHIPADAKYGPSLGVLREYEKGGSIDYDWVHKKDQEIYQ